MHIVRLLAPSLAFEDQTKDVDFSPRGIRARWQAGYEHTSRALEQAPWRQPFDKLDGVILHEMHEGRPADASPSAAVNVATPQTA
jgi:NTE family protein